MTSQVLIARGPPCSRFQIDSSARPTKLPREPTVQAGQKCGAAVCNAPKIYKADVQDRLPSFHLSYIRAVTPPPSLKQPVREALVCERKRRCPSGIGAMAGFPFGRRPATGLIQTGSEN